MGEVERQLPLLDIPEEEQKRLLQQMCLFDQLNFSFKSQKAKDVVASLEHLHPTRIVIEVLGAIKLRCYMPGEKHQIWIYFYHKPHEISPDTTVLPIPTSIRVFHITGDHGVSEKVGNPNNLDFKQYLEHLLEIFKCSIIEVLFGRLFQDDRMIQQDVFPVEPIYDAFKNINIALIRIDTKFYEQLITRLLPRTNACDIDSQHPFSQQSFQKFLIQNLKGLRFLTGNEPVFIGLDDLLMTNSSKIQVNTKFNEKDLNVFIRNWQSGSNPRLTQLHLNVLQDAEPIKENLVLKGTKFQTASPEKVSFYSNILSRGKEGFTSSGYTVRRVDGQEATVLLAKWSLNFRAFFIIIEE